MTKHTGKFINIKHFAFFDSILAQISYNYIKFASCVNYITMDEIRKINRLKAVLAEKGKTAKELALDLNVSPVTVSRWSQNTSQPDLETINKIATILGVDPRVLITGNEAFGVKL